MVQHGLNRRGDFSRLRDADPRHPHGFGQADEIQVWVAQVKAVRKGRREVLRFESLRLPIILQIDLE